MTPKSNLKSLKSQRKQLRSHLTSAEAKLWPHLQKSKIDGWKFRRQHSINGFILDFYCPLAKLAIELDSAPHFTEKGYQYDKRIGLLT